MKRALSLLSLAVLVHAAGCRSHPGVALTAGTAIAAFGTYVVIDADPTAPDEEGINKRVATVGAIVALAGVTLAMAGVIGFAQEGQEAQVAPSEQGGIRLTPVSASATASVAPGTSGDDSGASEDRHSKLVTHIRLAARANRCPAALFMLRELEQRDAATAQSLRATDEHVQRCQTAGQQI